MWRSGRVAEGVPLLRVYIRNGIEGSNPSFSAINKKGSTNFAYGGIWTADRRPNGVKKPLGFFSLSLPLNYLLSNR